MDPNATWELLWDVDVSIAERCRAGSDLARWIERGGFLPAQLTHLPRERAIDVITALRRDIRRRYPV